MSIIWVTAWQKMLGTSMKPTVWPCRHRQTQHWSSTSPVWGRLWEWIPTTPGELGSGGLTSCSPTWIYNILGWANWLRSLRTESQRRGKFPVQQQKNGFVFVTVIIFLPNNSMHMQIRSKPTSCEVNLWTGWGGRCHIWLHMDGFHPAYSFQCN